MTKTLTRASMSAAVLAAMVTLGAQAAPLSPMDVKNFEIASVEVVPVAEDLSPLNTPAPRPFQCEPTDPAVLNNQIDWSEVVRLGEQLWQIVANNRPVVNFQTPMVHVLPAGSDCWMDLEGWKGPFGAKYRLVFKNLYGMEVVSAAFRVVYYSNGNLANRGRFIANATVQPAELTVAWGFNFAAAVETGTVLNVGTLQQPIAGLPMTIKWQTKTVLQDSQGSVTLFVTGDGQLKAMD